MGRLLGFGHGVGMDDKFIGKFDGETSWKTVTWKTEKEMRQSL
jgi:hypothetical protein